MTKRLLLIFSALAGALLLWAAPVRAELDAGSILTAASLMENTHRNGEAIDKAKGIFEQANAEDISSTEEASVEA